MYSGNSFNLVGTPSNQHCDSKGLAKYRTASPAMLCATQLIQLAAATSVNKLYDFSVFRLEFHKILFFEGFENVAPRLAQLLERFLGSFHLCIRNLLGEQSHLRQSVAECAGG